jgi:hypothetical protein
MRTNPNIADPDDFYARLIALHDGLGPEESQAINARLILLMANQIGDKEVLDEILAAASATGRSGK